MFDASRAHEISFTPDSPSPDSAPVLPHETRAHMPAELLDEEIRRRRLEDEISTLAGHLNAANYRLIKLLEEFDHRGGWRGVGIRSLAQWLNFKCGIGRLAAVTRWTGERMDNSLCAGELMRRDRLCD